MITLYAIGYTQKTLQDFVRLLQKAGVDAVTDIRLRNTSRLAGYAKRDDLAFLLREGCGIECEHHPKLPPTPEILDAYKPKDDWPACDRVSCRSSSNARLRPQAADSWPAAVIPACRVPSRLLIGATVDSSPSSG